MISMNWVKDYVDLNDIDLHDLALKITTAGVNVEGIIDQRIPSLVIGEVIDCIDHPNSDHLHVCQVNIGIKVVQIVCGAANVRKGIKVIVALPGAILPGNFEIKQSKIRGVKSNGMICALFELGIEEKTEENYNKGIYELDENTPIGKDASEYLGFDDVIYQLDLNPNRNIDCTNHIGFAYEVASVLGKEVTLPNHKAHPIKENVEDLFKVSINTENCPMYLAKLVKNVKIKESPDFIKKRLEAAGMRSINNVVDISNYVMLEYGQPLHFFDKDKLGDKIEVRMAKEKEITRTLDGKNRILNKDDIVITDGEKVVCIAGVMGSSNTEVDQNTNNILIESAIFDPYHVRYTSLGLDLRSEASLRYERGLNYEYTEQAIERACYLLEKYADGEVLSGTIKYDTVKKEKKEAEVTLEQVNSTLGMKLTNNDIEASLKHLGFSYEKNNDIYRITIPNRRLDVEPNRADLIEEIGRLYGYDKIISTLPTTKIKSGKYVGKVEYRKDISKRLRTLGLNEARTYTLISEEDDQLFAYQREEKISLLKPMSQDKKIVRQSILASLLRCVEYNLARNVDDIMLYEISNTYANETEETLKVAIAMMGNYISNPWNQVKVKVDFYVLKGIIENLLDYLGYQNRYTFVAKEIPEMHPGMGAEILLDREPIGVIGRVHPIICKKELYMGELNIDKILQKKVRAIKYKEISKYPMIHKDLGFIVDKNISSQEISQCISKAGGKLLKDIHVFDVYEGENIGENEKSIAYSLTFNDNTKTLTEEEVMKVFNHIIKEVESTLNAKLRDK